MSSYASLVWLDEVAAMETGTPVSATIDINESLSKIINVPTGRGKRVISTVNNLYLK